MDVSARGILDVWRVLVAVLVVAGAVCASMPQNPEVVSTYTLESWQNQPGMADQTGRKPVHEGSLIACTNVEPKKDGNECLLKYEHNGKMYLEFHQTITATSADEVFLSCVSKRIYRANIM